jgi:14-3-3 protein epsilon
MTSKGYEKNVYLAMLAEQCNRFEEMSDYLEDLLKGRDKDINSDERNLLSIAYKNSVSSRRTALRTIMAYEMKEKKKETSTFLPYIQEYRKKVEDELTKMCNNVIATIDNHLLKKADDAEAKVFYLKMKGDYNRYIAEYAQGTLKDTVSKGALEAYQSASNIAKESLNAIHPISLGLALNFSVFYYEVMNDHETACKIAKDTLDFANSVPNLDEEDETQRDAIQIINLLRENLEMWKLEAEEAGN